MNKRIPIIISFLLLVFFIWVEITSFAPVKEVVTRLENMAYDFQLETQLFTYHSSPTSIAIVDIDDKSLKEEGRWPWPRSRFAVLINQLQEAGAVVIALDMLFPEKEENISDIVLQKIIQEKLNTKDIEPLFKKIQTFFDYDIQFAGALKKSDMVLGFGFVPRVQTQGLLPSPLLKLTSVQEKKLGFITFSGFISNISMIQLAAKNGGFINVFADSDGIIRRVPLLIRYEDGLYSSLALEAVRIFLLSNVKLIEASYNDEIKLEGIKIGDHLIPTDEKARAIIPFIGKSFTFPYYSAIDVLNKKFPSDAFQGKIIFIGTSATGLGDLQTTAVQSAFPGVEIQATVANGILQNIFSYRPPWAIGAEVFLTILLGLMSIFIFPHLGPRFLSVLIILIPVGLVLINQLLWKKTGLLISILIPILLMIIFVVVNVVYGYLFESLRRERLREMFGQYVPEKHIDEMLQTKSGYALLGEDREMTVLFADIRSFTTISEGLTASTLKELLNDFFTPMTEIIFKYHGTIDKYVGDMIMAFWGAPLPDKNHAENAINAALDMQVEVEKLKKLFLKREWPEVNIGIGLNSGMMSVGDMGSKYRRNYTVLGDNVNLASRVEGLTKYYGVNMIVTENTIKNQKGFVFRQLDRVRVKGKKTGIAIYEVICRESELQAALKTELELYIQALKHYFNQEWNQAFKIFSELNFSHPQEKLYTLYLRRIEEFIKTPPPKNWDGVYIHTSK